MIPFAIDVDHRAASPDSAVSGASTGTVASKLTITYAGKVEALSELGLDVIRERAWHRLPHWDPRRWQELAEGLQCRAKRNVRELSTLGIDWAKRLVQRLQHKTAQKLTKTRPSHGRPQRSEDGRKGGGKARAGSAHSARRRNVSTSLRQRGFEFYEGKG